MQSGDPYWQEEAQRQKARADREQKRKGVWLLVAFLLGLFDVFAIGLRISEHAPARWDVDCDKPRVALVKPPTWSTDAQRREFAWGTASNGTSGWLPIEPNGHPSTDPDLILREVEPSN